MKTIVQKRKSVNLTANVITLILAALAIAYMFKGVAMQIVHSHSFGF